MYDKETILKQVYYLLSLHKTGKLGGQKMPEDENPSLPKGSAENYLYFTLPMALNYQRNSYTLWECANKTFYDDTTNDVFSPQTVFDMGSEELRHKLTKYKVALQPNKQPEIWCTLCKTFVEYFNGDIRTLFENNNFCVIKTIEFIQSNKKKFPYLSGNKIMNYWFYVLEQYTDLHFTDRENISIAPDTHIIQASYKMGVITKQEMEMSNIQETVAQRWRDILLGTEFVPIDIHTPMWLWSRNKFEIKL